MRAFVFSDRRGADDPRDGFHAPIPLRSGEVCYCLCERLEDAGEERDLDAHVTPRLVGAKGTDEIHYPVGGIGFEGEDPLIVVEAERAGRVRKDVGILPAEHAVVSQHPASL